MTAPTTGVDVWLRPMPLATAIALLEGDVVDDDGPPWHLDYPLADTLVGVRLLTDAHRLAGWDGLSVPTWWIHQVVADGSVVGDIGFHGPASDNGLAEIGYSLVDAVHGRGIATSACRQVLARAWQDGAAAVVADTDPDNLASRRVLTKSGFVLRVDGVFECRGPARP